MSGTVRTPHRSRPAGDPLRAPGAALAPTARDTLLRDGSARLYRFRPPAGSREEGRTGRTPVLLVPSLINRWYVLDLRRGASVVEALVQGDGGSSPGEADHSPKGRGSAGSGGFDTWCLDWGKPEDEDRYLTWEDVLARLARAVRRVKRETGADSVALLGYCMGGTLSAIHAALRPSEVAALVNLAGPVDFSQGGFLREMSHPRWFDAAAVAAAGNVDARQMQSAFTMLRPTAQIAKWVSFAERGLDPEAREAFAALEAWAGDNIAFPAAAYETYIRDLYQENLLVKGEHRVGGRRVDLRSIRCPVLSVVASADTICPPPAATALNEFSGSEDAEVLVVPGGHVGAVVGGKARSVLYPGLVRWLSERLS